MSDLAQRPNRQIAPRRLDWQRRMFVAAARMPWASVLLTVGFLVLIVAAGLWSMAAAGAGDGDWLVMTGSERLAALAGFFLAVYQSGNFQVLVAMLLVGSVLEAIIPARRERVRNRAFNIPYGGMMLLFVTALAPLPVLIADTLVDWLGWRGTLDISFDTGDSVMLSCVAVLLSVAIADFFFYWFHRFQHGRLLWPQHAVHHSDVALNVTTTQRAHLLEHLLTPLAMTTPTALLFNLPTTDIVAVSLLPALWVYIVHMNIRLGFGRLWWLLTSPQYHRIHHSIEPQHRDRNFTLWMPLWDIVFRTAYAPARGEYPPTGVAGFEVSTVSGAFLMPFTRWYAMAAASIWPGVWRRAPRITDSGAVEADRRSP